MIAKLALATIMLAHMSGCAFPVRDDEIDWRLPPGAVDTCPDLTGRYAGIGELQEGGPAGRVSPMSLFMLMTGGVVYPFAVAKVNQLSSESSRQSVLDDQFVSVVAQNDDLVIVSIATRGGITNAVGEIELKHERISCFDRALVIRDLTNFPSIERGSGSVRYSETIIRKKADGSLIVTTYSAERLRSQLTGKAYGDTDTQSPRTWVFTPVK